MEFIDDVIDKKVYVGDKPSSIEVEYEGPMRTTIKISGSFVGDDKTKALYIARVTAWAGKSIVHVKYSLANSNSDHYSWRFVRDSTITLKLADKPEGSLLGADKPLEAGPEAWLAQSLFPKAGNRYTHVTRSLLGRIFGEWPHLSCAPPPAAHHTPYFIYAHCFLKFLFPIFPTVKTRCRIIGPQGFVGRPAG